MPEKKKNKKTKKSRSKKTSQKVVKKRVTSKSPKPKRTRTAKKREIRGFDPSHPNSLETAELNTYPHRWKPGQSGNPCGPRRGYLSLTHLLRQLLQAPAPEEESKSKGKYRKRTRGERLTGAQAIIGQLFKFAMSNRGDISMPALRMIVQRVDGKADVVGATQAVEQRIGMIIDSLEDSILTNLSDGKSRDNLLKAIGREPVEADEVHFNLDLDTSAEQSDADASLKKAISFYESVVVDTTAPVQARLRAQERLDVLLGHVEADKSNQSPEQQAESIRSFIDEASEGGGAIEPSDEESA